MEQAFDNETAAKGKEMDEKVKLLTEGKTVSAVPNATFATSFPGEQLIAPSYDAPKQGQKGPSCNNCNATSSVPGYEASCGPNGYTLTGVCFCRPGYYKLNGQCVPTSANQVLQPLFIDGPSTACGCQFTPRSVPTVPSSSETYSSCFISNNDSSSQGNACASSSCQVTPLSSCQINPPSSCPSVSPPPSCPGSGCGPSIPSCVPPAYVGCDGQCECP
jgi:hypothetical protein